MSGKKPTKGVAPAREQLQRELARLKKEARRGSTDRLGSRARPERGPDGEYFASGKEARRIQELRLLERAGSILYLRTQITFPLLVARYEDAKARPLSYRADAVYIEKTNDKWRSWKLVVEDVKGNFLSREYLRKERLMLQIYGIKIRRI